MRLRRERIEPTPTAPAPRDVIELLRIGQVLEQLRIARGELERVRGELATLADEINMALSKIERCIP
jgi:hypothetical protein